MLAFGVLCEIIGEFVGQCLAAPLLNAVEIWCAQLEPIFVRSDGAVTTYRHGLRVNLAFESAGKVNRLEVLRAEFREYAVDCAFNVFLKTIKNTHSGPFLSDTILRDAANLMQFVAQSVQFLHRVGGCNALDRTRGSWNKIVCGSEAVDDAGWMSGYRPYT